MFSHLRVALVSACVIAALLFFGAAPAQAAAPTSLQVTTPEDLLGLGSRLVFSTVNEEARPGHAFTIKNKGTGTLNITGLTFGGTKPNDFKLPSGTATSFSLAPGATRSITVNFRPPSGAGNAKTYISTATLTVKSNDATAPEYPIALSGLSSMNYEGSNEPYLQEIFTALGYKINVAATGKPKKLSISPSSAALGDEVLSAYWKRVDASKPVALVPIAHYSGKSKTGANSVSFGWYPKGGNVTNLYAFPGSLATGGINNGYGENQKLLPGTTSAVRSFNPTGSFGLADGNGARSADGDIANGKWHNMRFYPAKTPAGTVVPNLYLVGVDIGIPQKNGAKNWDAQDYAFLLINAVPDGGNNQPAAAPLAKSLSFDGGAGGVANTGFVNAQGAIDTAKLSLSSGKLRVVSSNDTNSTHTNALQVPFNAGTNFRIQSRLVGPFTSINAGSEQQAIYFGPSGQQFIKVEVDWDGTKRRLAIWRQNGTNGAVVGSVALPGGDATTIDLRIDVTPSSYAIEHADGTKTLIPPYADISYALNGSTTFTKIVPTNATYIAKDASGGIHVLVPDNFIAASVPAGIITSHQGGGSAFTGVFESFSIARR